MLDHHPSSSSSSSGTGFIRKTASILALGLAGSTHLHVEAVKDATRDAWRTKYPKGSRVDVEEAHSELQVERSLLLAVEFIPDLTDPEMNPAVDSDFAYDTWRNMFELVHFTTSLYSWVARKGQFKKITAQQAPLSKRRQRRIRAKGRYMEETNAQFFVYECSEGMEHSE